MDDLLSKFNEVIGQTFAAESLLDEEFKKCAQKLEEHISQSIANGTPVQTKKRPKRLDSLDHELDHDKSANASSSSNISSSHRQSHRNETIRSNLGELPEATSEPQQLEESVRPVRTARIKASKNMKEPTLKGKMRQPSIVIKQERISMEIRKERVDEPMDLDVENDANVLNGVAPLPADNPAPDVTQLRKSNDEGFGSTNEKDKEDAPSSRERSIVAVPLLVPKLEILSDDDEDAGRMPPPAMPPPSKPTAAAAKTRGRPKKDKSKVKKSDDMPMPIKREKDPEDSSAVSSAESSMSTASNSSRSVRSKKNSSQQLPEKIHIKQEKVSTGKASAKAAAAAANNSPAQSEKSVYEDALEGGDAVMRPATIALTKIVAGAEAEKNRTFALDKNGTFTAAANGTFVVPGDVANGTFNVKSPQNNPVNATFDVGVPQLPGPGGNSTFVMDSNSKKGTPEAYNASIMTDDNSHIEESPPAAVVAPPPAAKKPTVAAKKPQAAPKAGTKKYNELFSLQSPIKTRIEAFEKAAVSSPMQTRLHGGKTTTTPSQPARLVSKASTTPLASQRFPKASSVTTTPTAQNPLPARGMAASASKLAHLQKKPSTTTVLTKSQSLSREPSIDRGTLSAASSSSSLAIDEKKKKREEKQRLAQQQREQMEKEKREHAERQMREKEEKHRKLLQEREEKQRAELLRKAKKMEEFEKRRHLEELNQRMLADQKRDELAKLEQQQRAERDQAEIFKAKETYEIKLHKQMYQQKMQQHQKTIQAQLQLKKPSKQGSAATPVADPNQVYFTFEMIHSDDSTDDETDPAKKAKRPPVPSWSSKEERRVTIPEQSAMPLTVIDRFFSVRAMTPDLREIFPAIDSRKLKRNSSAVWRTPPRYSQMPKY